MLSFFLGMWYYSLGGYEMIIDGKKVREDKLRDLKARIDALDKKLTLVVVKVGVV